MPPRDGTQPSPNGAPHPRGEPPCPPVLPPRHMATASERLNRLRDREAAERRSILRGLCLLALLVIVFAVVEFGWHRAFPAGWWRRW